MIRARTTGHKRSAQEAHRTSTHYAGHVQQTIPYCIYIIMSDYTFFFRSLNHQTKMNAGHGKPSAHITPPVSTLMDRIAANVTVDGHYGITHARVRIPQT